MREREIASIMIRMSSVHARDTAHTQKHMIMSISLEHNTVPSFSLLRLHGTYRLGIGFGPGGTIMTRC